MRTLIPIDLFFYLILMLICSALAISSLILNSNTNAGVTLKKMRTSEGFYGFILILASIWLFVGCIKAFKYVSGFEIAQVVFILIMSVLGVAIGVLLGLTLLMKAGASLPEAAAVPTPPVDGSSPPPVPPAIPAGAQVANAANALNMIRVPLGFAGLGITLVVYIFSFF